MKRSINDMAKEAQFLGIPEQNAIVVIKNVLSKFHDDGLQGSQF